MKKAMQLLRVAASISIIAMLVACSTGTEEMDRSYEAERRQLLENYGKNIMVPAYKELQSAVDDLEAAAVEFSGDRTEARLQAVQEALKAARLAWQDASLFQFGPAESVLLRTSLNTYPTDTTKVEDNVESGNYTLGAIANSDAVGFPALDYLLHGLGETRQETLSWYTEDQGASKRIAYLRDNIEYIKGKTDAVADAWSSSGGNYIETFLSEDNAGTDVGSSLGMAVNALVMHYERFVRDGKIGIPAGVRSAGHPRPAATEAVYGGYSVELALANLQAIKRLFMGSSASGNGKGLDDILEYLDASNLSGEIQTELDEAIAELEKLNDPLSEQIRTDNDPVLEAFKELQDVIILLKADMTSILGITITYQDNDGD